MMDQFLEEVVTKRNRGVQTAAYIMANLMMVLLGLTAFLNFISIRRFSPMRHQHHFCPVLLQILYRFQRHFYSSVIHHNTVSLS